MKYELNNRMEQFSISEYLHPNVQDFFVSFKNSIDHRGYIRVIFGSEKLYLLIQNCFDGNGRLRSFIADKTLTSDV